MGAKNTFLSVGRPAGLAAAVVDIGKGVLVVVLARAFGASEIVILLAGACAILGHDFPLFLRFQGGQGMATMTGIFIMLYPGPMALALGAMAIVLSLSRNWNLSCAAASITLLFAMLLGGQTLTHLLYVLLLLPTLALMKMLQVRRTQTGVTQRLS